MKRISKKLLVAALSVMLIMCTAVTILSYSLADEPTGSDGETGSVATVNAETANKTVIDYIIENSKNTDADADPVYHIVEIGSGSQSVLAQMVSENKFKDYVIDGNRTIEDMMEEGKIDFKFFSVQDLPDSIVRTEDGYSDTDPLAIANNAVQAADFIYVSNDPSAPYTNTNDIPEVLKLSLATFAVGDMKPMIIDSPTQTAEIAGSKVYTTTQLVDSVYSIYGNMRYTFLWTNDLDAATFLGRQSIKSMYLPIKYDDVASNWEEVYKNVASYTKEEDEETVRIAKVLTINGGSSTTLTDKLKADLTPATDVLSKDKVYVEPDDPTVEDTRAYAEKYTFTDIDNTNLYNLDEDSALREKGYTTREEKPDYVRFETVTLSTGTSVLADIDLSQYDVILVESDCANKTIPADDYNKLSSAMYSYVHILYAEGIGVGTSSSTGKVEKSTANNYNYLFYQKVANETETSRFGNVLVTNRDKMQVYYAATSGKGVKDIADIIKAGAFRSIGGDSSASLMYTVLEIQPAYPIDLKLADKFSTIKSVQDGMSKRNSDIAWDGGWLSGYYYLRTSSVLNNTTSDEISYDGVNSVTEMESTNDYSTITTDNWDNITDYYAWELSKAKIAHATGRDISQINIVHMSAYEFQSTKTSLLDNYDLIYIGGDNSALKPAAYFRAEGGSTKYNMYYHNGDVMSYFSYFLDAQNGSKGVAPGNDLTEDKLKELKEYIGKGMPVVFSKDVTDAYDTAVKDQYKNTLIDPDSNMYQLLKFAKDKAETLDNILWGFNQDDTIKVTNAGGQYGTTYNGYATVFAGVETEDYTGTAVTSDPSSVNELDLVSLLENSAERPKFALTKSPILYVEGDKNSTVSGTQLKYSYDIVGSAKYTINVYVDDNGDSKFTSGEIIKTGSGSGSGNITAPLADDYYGPVLWKFEIVASNGATASTTGLSKVERPSTEDKSRVSVLQIMPENSAGQNNYGTLWLCTECQQGKYFYSGNRCTKTGKYSFGAHSGTAYYSRDNMSFSSASGVNLNQCQSCWVGSWVSGWRMVDRGTFYECTNCHVTVEKPASDPAAKPDIAKYDSTYTYTGNDLGIHEHTFGIVKYDSNYTVDGKTGIDNWTTNWAENLYDDYNFDLDILTTRQYEALCSNIINDYKNLSEDDRNDISTKVATYQLCYTVMQKLIAGEYDQVDTKEKAEFESIMASLGADQDLIKAYGKSQTDLDDYLTAVYKLIRKNNKTYFDKGTVDQCADEMLYEIKYHNYYDFYSLYNSEDNLMGQDALFRIEENGKRSLKFTSLYLPWRNAKIYENYFYEKYMYYLKLSGVKASPVLDADGKEVAGQYTYDLDLTKAYSCLVVGAAAYFGYDDINELGCSTIKTYINNDGHVLLFHDTLIAGNEKSNTAGKTMSSNLRQVFGMDSRHLESNVSSPSTKISLTGSSKYFMSSVYANGGGSTVTTVGLTSRTLAGNSQSGTNKGGLMYKYALYFPSDSEGVPSYDSTFDYWNFKGNGSAVATDTASQNNKGIVTLYPFKIDSQLVLSPTHGQDYALDVEDSDLTVWYSLAGGSIGTQSSLFAADPNNGAENYFIYSYKNVTYCGAGHSMLTGYGNNNNDERRLIINVICNSVKKSAIGLTAGLFDYDATEDTLSDANKTVIDSGDGENYTIKVKDTDKEPKFSFAITEPASGDPKIKSVRIFYDLDYDDGVYHAGAETTNAYPGADDDDHITIMFRQNTTDKPNVIESSKLYYVDGKTADAAKDDADSTYTNKLMLRQSYFDAYGGEYTYIVVEITDSNNKKIYKRIKITRPPMLYDLT